MTQPQDPARPSQTSPTQTQPREGDVYTIQPQDPARPSQTSATQTQPRKAEVYMTQPQDHARPSQTSAMQTQPREANVYMILPLDHARPSQTSATQTQPRKDNVQRLNLKPDLTDQTEFANTSVLTPNIPKGHEGSEKSDSHELCPVPRPRQTISRLKKLHAKTLTTSMKS